MIAAKTIDTRHKGATLLLSMIFVLVFSALAMSLATLSGANIQVASNQRKANTALYAAQSGLECAKYLVKTVSLAQTNINYVTNEQANQAWIDLCQHIQNQALDGKTVAYDANELTIQGMTFGGSNATFDIRLHRDPGNPHVIMLKSTGTHDAATRTVGMAMDITKDREVLSYAVASRGRIWLDVGSVVYGPLFSTWNRPEVSPGIETSPGTAVYGTVGTVIPLASLQANGFQMETLASNDSPIFYFGVSAFDAEGNPISDTYGPVNDNGYLLDFDLNPVYDAAGNPIPKHYDNRYYSSSDYVGGYHEDIHYNVPFSSDMPGMQPEDYDTSGYKAMCSVIGAHDGTTIEYFPHAEGDYSQPRPSGGSYQYNRRVYENQTFSNIRVPRGQHALFKNCTFEDILFIETRTNYYNSASYTNNIRFEDCTFNGVIVTDVPSSTNYSSWWRRNALTFTGQSFFQNTSSIQEATVLAPNFNVNIGSTAQVGDTSNSVITGAVVGGIVDVYGDATIHGTIISMYDTSAHSSGYITNIGDREDGGSESYGTIEGQINITPNPEQMLPSGITSPIIIKPDPTTYSESV